MISVNQKFIDSCNSDYVLSKANIGELITCFIYIAIYGFNLVHQCLMLAMQSITQPIDLAGQRIDPNKAS